MSVISDFWRYRNLIRLLTLREVVGRYKGSFLGIGWSFIHPLVMLTVYTFVFSIIFKTKWGVQAGEGKLDFALTLFMGLITFRMFSELVCASPSLMIRNANYVKKVVFPLEILPLVAFLNSLINSVLSVVVLLIVLCFSRHSIQLTLMLLPIVWIPIIFFSMGIGYLLASIGVFIRDLSVTVEIVVNMLMFLCPIFYPVQAVPHKFQFLIRVNPIALSIEDARRVVLWGMMPDWWAFMGNFFFSILIFSLGMLCFIKTKNVFAEIL